MPMVFVKSMNTSRLCIMINQLSANPMLLVGDLYIQPPELATKCWLLLHIHKIVNSSSSADKGFSVMLSWQAPCLKWPAMLWQDRPEKSHMCSTASAAACHHSCPVPKLRSLLPCAVHILPADVTVLGFRVRQSSQYVVCFKLPSISGLTLVGIA